MARTLGWIAVARRARTAARGRLRRGSPFAFFYNFGRKEQIIFGRLVIVLLLYVYKAVAIYNNNNLF